MMDVPTRRAIYQDGALQHPTAGVLRGAVQDLEEGGFPGAGRTHEPGQAAGGEGEGDIAEDGGEGRGGGRV